MLIILPADYFDHGESICPSVIFFNRECFGCGTTRATMHMLHLQFREAWHFNRLSFALVPFLLYMYVSLLIKFTRRARYPDGKPKQL
ncbi:MAG TPA: DUF2752 domain-containing protein [Bacteroidia bacterium]|nr:DUF2752 domain-containing protein [Bacteroidia bacterium]